MRLIFLSVLIVSCGGTSIEGLPFEVRDAVMSKARLAERVDFSLLGERVDCGEPHGDAPRLDGYALLTTPDQAVDCHGIEERCLLAGQIKEGAGQPVRGWSVGTSSSTGGEIVVHRYLYGEVLEASFEATFEDLGDVRGHFEARWCPAE